MSLLRIASRRFNKIKLFNDKNYKILFSTDTTEEKPIEVKPGGYAQAYEKFETIKDSSSTQQHTFASLLRNSRLIDLGDPEGKTVIGKIFHIIDDDLYIDFGWKFHCVCPRPKKDSSSYIKGARVRLRIKELELSSRFLGFEKDLTLLEADCTLLGLIQEGSKSLK